MNRKKAEQVFYELFDRNCGRWNGIARCYAAPAERDDLLQETPGTPRRYLPHSAGLVECRQRFGRTHVSHFLPMSRPHSSLTVNS